MIARLGALSHAQTRRLRKHSRGPTTCEQTAGNGGANDHIRLLVGMPCARAASGAVEAKGQIGLSGAADLQIEASSA